VQIANRDFCTSPRFQQLLMHGLYSLYSSRLFFSKDSDRLGPYPFDAPYFTRSNTLVKILCCFIWAINLNSHSAGKHRGRFMTLLLGFIYYVVLCRREEICKQNFGCKNRRDDMENLIVVRRITI